MKHKIKRMLATMPESSPVSFPLIKPKENAQITDTAIKRHIATINHYIDKNAPSYLAMVSL